MKFKLVPDSGKKINAICWIIRIVVGAVLIFSGFVKCIDPWGAMYKFGEYFAVWGLDFPREIVLILASSLSIFEFSLGAMILLGCFRRVTVWLFAAFMTIMTALTVYLYVADPVSDCGCFGDALKLTNGETLLKNIVLCLLAAYLVLINHRVRGLVGTKVQWFTITATVLYCASVSFVGYHRQPLIDFRPYGTGEVISQTQTEPVDTDGMKFVYEKNGERREFDAENIPDDSWTFVERIEPENPINSADLVINDVDGDDVTAEVISDKGKTLLMIVSAPERIGLSRSHMAAKLAEAMEKGGGQFATVIASDYPGGIEAWQNKLQAEDYDIYEAEDTDLEMLVRGDMALVYIEDGVIRWKYNVYYFGPEFGDDILKNPGMLEQIKPIEESGTLRQYTLLYVLSIILSIVCKPLVCMIKKTRKSEKTQEDNSPEKTIATTANQKN